MYDLPSAKGSDVQKDPGVTSGLRPDVTNFLILSIFSMKIKRKAQIQPHFIQT
jgi:hypothetical protein